jgi:hypothetical protein
MIILKAGDDVACARGKKRRGYVSPYNVLGKFSSIILSSGVSIYNSARDPVGYMGNIEVICAPE